MVVSESEHGSVRKILGLVVLRKNRSGDQGVAFSRQASKKPAANNLLQLHSHHPALPDNGQGSAWPLAHIVHNLLVQHSLAGL
jgi:hypothetical protein